jgi:hypothetical protein
MSIFIAFGAGFVIGGMVFLLVGFTVGRNVGAGEDHFLPPLKKR